MIGIKVKSGYDYSKEALVMEIDLAQALGKRESVEASLYYLYMMADGEVTYSEEKIFDTICKELDIDYDTKEKIIKKCKEFAGKNSDMLNVIMSEKIDEQSGQNWFGERDLSKDARIIWNLVNLGYADNVYSEEERKISKYLVDKWSVNLEVYQEFIDIADTMLALVKQREWVLSTFTKGRERDKKEKKIESEMEQLLSDVNLTIEELTM